LTSKTVAFLLMTNLSITLDRCWSHGPKKNLYSHERRCSGSGGVAVALDAP
jgi:hypothetical protein